VIFTDLGDMQVGKMNFPAKILLAGGNMKVLTVGKVYSD